MGSPGPHSTRVSREPSAVGPTALTTKDHLNSCQSPRCHCPLQFPRPFYMTSSSSPTGTRAASYATVFLGLGTIHTPNLVHAIQAILPQSAASRDAPRAFPGRATCSLRATWASPPVSKSEGSLSTSLQPSSPTARPARPPLQNLSGPGPQPSRTRNPRGQHARPAPTARSRRS